MGLYLYGEMAISQNKVLNAISLKVFEDLRDEFDPSTLANLTEMLKKEEDDGDKWFGILGLLCCLYFQSVSIVCEAHFDLWRRVRWFRILIANEFGNEVP